VINLKRFLKLNPLAIVFAVISKLCLFPTLVHASEPAFDCANATGQIQQLVCSDEELAELDRQLADVYLTALENLPQDDVPMVKAEQRGWIKGRDDCWKANDEKQCATTEYQTRIVQLQIISGQLSAPDAVGLDCGATEQTPFFAVFYADTSPPAVVLTRGQDQVIAFIDRSGSGARYITSGVEFWEHQAQATVDWFGTKLKCSIVK
jgi:uncharacterized protein